MSICGYIRIYLAVYGPEIIGGFGFEEKSNKTKAVCGLRRTNYGSLRNVRPPIIDPLFLLLNSVWPTVSVCVLLSWGTVLFLMICNFIRNTTFIHSCLRIVNFQDHGIKKYATITFVTYERNSLV